LLLEALAAANQLRLVAAEQEDIELLFQAELQ
jgi:hypothetical protein